MKTITPQWRAPAGIQACCTTRSGGFSLAPFDSFNLALHVGDDESRVLRNRGLLCESLQLAREPDWINQTHGIRSVTLEQEQSRDADAAVTREPGRVAVVMTADCLPILLCNREGSEVAAIHAGWRGLQAGVIQSALTAMNSPAGQLIAWIGPGISQASFEVGDEVRVAFVDSIRDAPAVFSAHIANITGYAISPGSRPWCWRSRACRRFTAIKHCSYRDAGEFYSYRRDATYRAHG